MLAAGFVRLQTCCRQAVSGCVFVTAGEGMGHGARGGGVEAGGNLCRKQPMEQWFTGISVHWFRQSPDQAKYVLLPWAATESKLILLW